ncbi:MAG: clostripain-related cysteine peptidase [Anaerolineae bacterium]
MQRALPVVRLCLLLIALACVAGAPPARIARAQSGVSDKFLLAIAASSPVGRLENPLSVAVGSDDSIYVSDHSNNRIQRFNRAGSFVSLWGSTGGSSGQFSTVGGVALSPNGSVYVVDTGNNRVQVFDAAGFFQREWGRQGVDDGEFLRPERIAVAPDGSVYVADSANHRVQHFDATGGFLGKWGTYGAGAGEFYSPEGVAVAPDGTVYVAYTWSHRIQRFTATGTYLGAWGGRGAGNGQFAWPEGMAVAPNGTVYVADSYNLRVQYFDATGRYLGQWGSLESGARQFVLPMDVTLERDGSVLVVDTNNHRVQRFTPGGQFVASLGARDVSDSQLSSPWSVAASPDGTVYVTDEHVSRVQHFSADGAFLGKWGSVGSGAGQFGVVGGVAVATDGTVYVVDRGNSRVQYFSPTGVFLGTRGQPGSGDGQFSAPLGIAIGPSDTVYVADAANHRIQYFDRAGRFLGKWGSEGNGTGQFQSPDQLAVSAQGIVYVADFKRPDLQYFSATGEFRGILRTSVASSGVAVAPDETVYIADFWGHTISRFSPSGAFLSQFGKMGGMPGAFYGPRGLAFAANGTFYATDCHNSRVQVFGSEYATTWRGQYFSTRWLASAPTLIRNDAAVSFDWGLGSPDPRVPPDDFGVRWYRYVSFADGRYRFEVSANDAARLWVDDQLLIENSLGGGWSSSAVAELAERYHYVQLDYAEGSGPANVRLSWQSEAPVTRPAWTFMLYLPGDNNLYSGREKAVHALEALSANPNVNIVVLFDGDRRNDSWRFLVHPGGQYTLGVKRWYLGEVNTGDPSVLSDFITWAHDQYPADHYYLAIADHGHGTQGAAWDNSSNGDHLTPTELRTALGTATNGGQWRLDVVHYDTCLMAMLEDAYQIKDYANYMVASENLGWWVFPFQSYLPDGKAAPAAPYEFATVAASVTRAMTPQQLAVSIARAYFDHPALAQYPRTISALDLRYADEVRQRVDALASVLRTNLDAVKANVRYSRDSAPKFDSRDYYRITVDDEFVDLYHLAFRLGQFVPRPEAQLAAQRLIDTIKNDFVVKEYHESGTWIGDTDVCWSLDNAHGVAIYFPPRPGSQDYNRYAAHQLFRFTSDSTWDDFLADYYGVLGLPPDDIPSAGQPPMLGPRYPVFLPMLLVRDEARR